MEELKEKINKIIPLSQTHLFYKGKIILSEKTLVKLEDAIEQKIKKPSKNIEVIVMRVSLLPKEKHPLTISCSINYITPELELESKLASFYTVYYTKEEIDKYGFKKSYIVKIINVLKKNLVSLRNFSASITDVLNV